MTEPNYAKAPRFAVAMQRQNGRQALICYDDHDFYDKLSL
jgi:hypothetical protein